MKVLEVILAILVAAVVLMAGFAWGKDVGYKDGFNVGYGQKGNECVIAMNQLKDQLDRNWQSNMNSALLQQNNDWQAKLNEALTQRDNTWQAKLNSALSQRDDDWQQKLNTETANSYQSGFNAGRASCDCQNWCRLNWRCPAPPRQPMLHPHN